MKLMVIGSDRIYAIENFYVKYLRQAGVDVFHFPAQSIFYDYYQGGILNKLVYRAGLSGILKRINSQFIEAVKKFKPEAVWVFKGMELFPETLKEIKGQGIKLVNFNGDSPFLFSGTGSGNKNVTQSIGLYDLHLTYNSAVKKEMEKKFGICTAILPFGFDINDELYEACCNQTEIMRVCFLGNPDISRGKFLQQLAEKNIPLDLYGNDWEKFVQHPSVNIYKPVYADECWKVLRRYRVQLNLMRPHNPDTHNMRTFELGGIGAIQLAPSTEDHLRNYEPGEEIYLYTGIEECVMQINKLLALDTESADRIRLKTRKRSLESGYTYRDRTLQALQKIREILG